MRNVDSSVGRGVMTNDDPPRRGDVIGQRVGGSYVVTSLLGEGGMGQVFVATNEMLAGKRAALKILLHELTRRPEALGRFRAEVYATAKIDDANIVQVFDAGELADGRLYMLMEFCAGGSLADLLEKRGALPLELIVTIMSQVGSALDAAHAANITHRDIKPANILLAPQSSGGPLRAKLGDFGIAKLHDDQFALGMQTGTKKVLGSPGYMAPEQCMGRGAGAADHRADVYAFASVVYEMVTGRRPYSGTNVFDLITSVAANAPIPPPRELRRDLPLEWDSIIMAGLAHRREDRIQTVKEMIRRLARSIPNGEALMSYVAPRLIDNMIAPTAPTISDGIGSAASQWAAAHSTMGGRARSRIGRTLTLLVAGIAVGGASVAFVAYRHTSSNVGAEPNAPTIAMATPVDATTMAPPPSLPSQPSLSVLDASNAPPPQDAATIVATMPADAAPLPAASNDAGSTTAVAKGEPTAPRRPDKPPRTVQAPAEPGTLRIEVEPWAQVSIVGRKETWTTPVTTNLPAGHYRVVLANGPKKETVDVTITPERTTRIERTW